MKLKLTKEQTKEILAGYQQWIKENSDEETDWDFVKLAKDWLTLHTFKENVEKAMEKMKQRIESMSDLDEKLKLPIGDDVQGYKEALEILQKAVNNDKR